MLTILSGMAIILTTVLLIISSWLSVSEFAWIYYIIAGLIVLVWAQPWSRVDPYRTGWQPARWGTYLVITLIGIATGLVFARVAPFMISVEAIILGIIELTGWRTSREKFE
jgi:hypothetical protein